MLNLLQHDTCGVIENNQIDSCSFFFLVRKCQHQLPTQSVSPPAEGRLASTDVLRRLESRDDVLPEEL